MARPCDADFGGASVTPIDTATNTAGAPIPVGLSPHGIGIAPDGSRVYVSALDSSAVSVIDTATQTVVATIPAGTFPYAIAITPDGATVYVTDLVGSAVIPIDTATGTAGTPIPVGERTYGVAISPDGATAYVSQRDTGNVIPIDVATGGTAGAATHVGQAPMTVAITPNRSPAAAFDASADGLGVRLDASASTDRDGSVARYDWDFGDGQSATTAQPTVTHAFAQPGSYAVTLTVTDDEGCSRALVFTGQTASCTGSAGARVAHAVAVGEPGGGPSRPITPAAGRQAIERFALDRRCVRAHDGRARVGLRLRLALPGSVQVQVHRALARFNTKVCPKPHGRFHGKLRRVATVPSVAPQVIAASVRTHLTRSFELAPGLYRIGVRAHRRGGGLTPPAYRWVRVLGQSAGAGR